MDENWRVWNKSEFYKNYGDVFYKRATGQMPEMESSKAVAEYIAKIVEEDDNILDVGCGGGHYLVSLDKRIKKRFSYLGLDATEYYIQNAKKAFLGDFNDNPLREKTNFTVGDIYDLNIKSNSADIVMCNNLLLHLPSIERPIAELWRVTKKYLVIRTLLGKSSFRIKHINTPECYDDEGEPISFNYLNIYSEEYLEKIIGELKHVKKSKFITDQNFDPKMIGESNYTGQEIPFSMTKIVNGMQVNHYIIYPWQLIIIEKNSPKETN